MSGAALQIRMIQTADAEAYRVMFDITSRPSRRYCELHDIDYRPFIGIKRGVYPWQATYNRIVLLTEMIAEGYRGWVIYLDADAYVADFGFDVRRYLADNAGWGLIAPAGGDTSYMPNTGCMLFNLADRRTRDVVAVWQAAFDTECPDEVLRAAPSWIGDGDMSMLHCLLDARGDSDALVKIEPFALMGWPQSSWLRQNLRKFGSFAERCQRLFVDVAAVMDGSRDGR